MTILISQRLGSLIHASGFGLRGTSPSGRTPVPFACCRYPVPFGQFFVQASYTVRPPNKSQTPCSSASRSPVICTSSLGRAQGWDRIQATYADIYGRHENDVPDLRCRSRLEPPHADEYHHRTARKGQDVVVAGRDCQDRASSE